MRKNTLWIGAIGTALLATCTAALANTIVEPEARAQTVPVPHKKDAADDPAIWIHPRNPELSLILGTDKQGALHTYNMDGSSHEAVADSTKPNNVDVMYGFKLAGRTVDLAVAGTHGVKSKMRSKGQGAGMTVWAIDPATRHLSDVTEGGVIRVLAGKAAHGLCGYHSARSGRCFVFVTSEKGKVEQHELRDGGNGSITGVLVRTLNLGSLAEGCVADDELGLLYVSEETVGIWKFGAEPDAGTEGKLIARVGENGLTADVEGLTVYYAAKGRGYLIASSQGNNTFKVYERAEGNRFVLTIDPKDGRIDDVSHTDGICVTSCPTSRQFSKGLFIAQDDMNAGGNQNFKLYAWEDIAGTNLLIDTKWQPRGTGRRTASGRQ